MRVHVKRGGVWIDAEGYEVGEEILVGGHTPAVVRAVGVGGDGVPTVDFMMAPKCPVERITFHFTPCEAPDSAPDRECPTCGGFHPRKDKAANTCAPQEGFGDAVLHRLWTQAVGQPGYDKAAWQQLERLVHAGIAAGYKEGP